MAITVDGQLEIRIDRIEDVAVDHDHGNLLLKFYHHDSRPVTLDLRNQDGDDKMLARVLYDSLGALYGFKRTGIGK